MFFVASLSSSSFAGFFSDDLSVVNCQRSDDTPQAGWAPLTGGPGTLCPGLSEHMEIILTEAKQTSEKDSLNGLYHHC